MTSTSPLRLADTNAVWIHRRRTSRPLRRSAWRPVDAFEHHHLRHELVPDQQEDADRSEDHGDQQRDHDPVRPQEGAEHVALAVPTGALADSLGGGQPVLRRRSM